MARLKCGYTLVELLLVIALVGLLIALLLPAVQSVRETARQLQCKNNLRQMGLAVHLYHHSWNSFPPGIDSSNRMFWSGFVLPHLEQHALHDLIDIDLPWDEGTNAQACATYIPVYRCPSSTAPRHLTAQGITDRMPADYIACTSGTATRESGPPPVAGDADADGMFFIDSRTRWADIPSGTSNTVALGEAMFLYRAMGVDHSGSPQFMDRWYIGTFEGLGNEVSEAMGSTGVAINSHLLDVFVDEKELSFGSHHVGGAQVAFADGAVRFIAETIDRVTWSALGSRNAAAGSGNVVDRSADPN